MGCMKDRIAVDCLHDAACREDGNMGIKPALAIVQDQFFSRRAGLQAKIFIRKSQNDILNSSILLGNQKVLKRMLDPAGLRVRYIFNHGRTGNRLSCENDPAFDCACPAGAAPLNRQKGGGGRWRAP